MPLVFRQAGQRFHFFSNEGDPREPAHVHVDGPDGRAKFWLNPEVHVAFARGYAPRVVNELLAVVRANRDLIERRWNDHFGR